MRRTRAIPWSAYKEVIERALRENTHLPPSTRVEGSLARLGSGLNHANFVFHLIADQPVPPEMSPLVLRRVRDEEARDHTAIERLHLEAETLQALARLDCGFGAPRFVCFVADENGVDRGLIETVVDGFPLELNPREQERRAIEAIARAATFMHRLPVAAFEHLPHCPDANAHLAAETSRCERLCSSAEPEAAAAVAWIRQRQPLDRPSTVLHGDLLPQNILLALEPSKLGLVDFEFARIGDPAYDLAIVTRGNRKVLGMERGVHRLVRAYRETGGVAVEPADVMTWELILVLGWLQSALDPAPAIPYSGQPPDVHRQRLRAVLRRAGE